MADEEVTITGPAQVTVSPDYGEGTSASQQVDGAFKTHEADLTDEIGDELDQEVDEGLKDGNEELPEGEKPKGDEDTAKEGETPEPVAIDLPAFDAENKEVRDQYASKYLSEDGKALNFSAFNDSFYANRAAGLVDIHPDERAFVKAEMGVSDEAINTYLAGLDKGASELTEKQDTAIATVFGAGTADKAGYDAAMEWAVTEGYTQAQKDRYNAALKAFDAGDPSLLDEQVELLRVRYDASGKKAAPKADPKPAQRQRREVSPPATATSSSTPGLVAGAIEPFKTIEEFNTAQALAYKKGDRKEMQEVSARMKASPKLWKGTH